MKRVFAIILLSLVLVASAFGTNYYAHPSGAAAIGDCDFASHAAAQAASNAAHCSLKTVLSSQATTGASDTIYLRGGTYAGKFFSTLDGATVRSFCTALVGGCAANPSEWAIIDGYHQTTFNGAVADAPEFTSDEVVLTSVAGISVGNVFRVGTGEEMVIDGLVGTTATVTRGWNGTTTTSHANGATITLCFNTFVVNGANSTYRDFEVMNSLPDRGESTPIPEHYRGTGISVTGDDNSFINLLIHDNVVGAGASPATSDTLWYGNVFWNNGNVRDSTYGNLPSGIAMYSSNGSGFARIYNNIGLNSFNPNGQFGDLVGGDLQKNVWANAGAPSEGFMGANWRTFNVLYHHEETITGGMSIADSIHWQPENADGGYVAGVGFAGDIDTLTVTDNIFIGGEFTVRFGTGASAATFTGNQVDGPNFSYINKPSGMTQNTWDNNTYHNASGRSVFDYHGSLVNFASWQSSTGKDASSTQTASVMPDTVRVIPNANETGRCTVVVMAKSDPTSINVNLTTCGLSHGQSYVIKNAFDWNGGDVATGTYNSGSPTVSVPLNGEADDVATPVGMTFTAATTAPEFAVMVVLPSSQGGGVRAAMGGAVKLSGGVRLQ